jgi:hypothetical protein
VRSSTIEGWPCDSDNHGDSDDMSQGGYDDGTLEVSSRGDATRAGGQEVLSCRSEAGEAPGEA